MAAVDTAITLFYFGQIWWVACPDLRGLLFSVVEKGRDGNDC